MHDEQQRQPDARTQQVLNRVRHIINKKNTQFILDHQHDSLAALSLYLRVSSYSTISIRKEKSKILIFVF